MFDLDDVNPPVPPAVYTDTLVGLPQDILSTMISQGLAPDTETAIVTTIPTSGTPGQPNYYPGGTYTESEDQRRVRSLGSKKFPYALSQAIITNENKTFKSVDGSGVVSYIQKGNAIKAFRGRKTGLDFVLTSASLITFKTGAYYIADANITASPPAINVSEYWVIKEVAFTLDISGASVDTPYYILANSSGVISYLAVSGATTNYLTGPTALTYGYHVYSSSVSYRILGMFTIQSTFTDSTFIMCRDFTNLDGNWLCIASGSTVAGTPTYSSNKGQFTKNGRSVNIGVDLTLTNLGGLEGNLSLTLPTSTFAISAISLGYITATTLPAGYQLLVHIGSGTIVFYIYNQVAGTSARLTHTNMTDASRFILNGTYFAGL